MNKSGLKTFAISSRNELREKVMVKLEILGINIDGIKDPQSYGNMVSINGFEFDKSKYDSLMRRYNEVGYEEVVEEIAYTWFNRLVAIGYMEYNEYIEEKFVGSSSSKVDPDIIDNYFRSDFFDELDDDVKNKIYDLKDKNKTEEMYALLVEEKCHELSKIMPFMFEKTGNYSELLFPNGLLLEGSFLVKLREILEESKEEVEDEYLIPVELIGWLYQFYNQDKRDLIFDSNMSNRKKIEKKEIPSATQIFTPKWIVKYMAENSLGKLAVESLGVTEELKKGWKYYITPPSDGSPLKEDQSAEKLAIEDIKILDPAMGSGHILTYSFDLLYDIYEDLGWSTKDAVLSILQNNIYGLEIDDRAGMLASFAIMMKAREKFKRLFRVLNRLDEDEKITLNTLAIQESNGIGTYTKNLINDNNLSLLDKLITTFEDGKEYGSILKIEKFDEKELYNEIAKLEEAHKSQGQMGLFAGTGNISEDLELLNRLIHQSILMGSKYDVTITNPPYMGNARMSVNLKNYLQKNYKDVKSDLFAVFIKESHNWTKKNGRIALVTPYVWWFLKSYEELRNYVLNNMSFDSLIQLEYNAFEGATIPVGTFTFKNNYNKKNCMTGIKLSEFKGITNQPIKTLEAIENPECGWRYQTPQKDFEKIPGSPIAYWVSDRVKEIFATSEKLGEVGDAKQGLATADNDRFLRLWTEVNTNNYKLDSKNAEEALESGKKWFPYNKGGEKRKWYGNQEFLVNWEKNGYEIKNFFDARGKLRSRPQNTEFYFKPSISWGLITSGGSSFRYFPNGFIYDVAGMSYFTKETQKNKMLGVLNSKLYSDLAKILNPTINLQIGDVANLPNANFENQDYESIVKNNISIAKQEWDSRETSWDFENSPLINNETSLLEDSIKSYETTWREKFFEMHSNEEELNRLFIEIYGLQDEMDEKVELKDITLLKKESKLIPSSDVSLWKKETGVEFELTEAEKEQNQALVFDRNELVKQFLSYAVGCIVGRYSIDKSGLIIANSDDDIAATSGKLYVVGEDGEERHLIENPRFIMDTFGVIPITTEASVFKNDIVTKVVKFVETVYGSEALESNLSFIGTNIGMKSSESPREAIRRYFIKDFYKDHLQRYKKRPIYWMVNSGKKDGFNALIYMHRYRENTIARIRTDYINEYQETLENMVNNRLRALEDDEIKAKERKNLEKEIKGYNGQIEELKKFAGPIKDFADKKISIDLDDGVKVNYEKFKGILKKI